MYQRIDYQDIKASPLGKCTDLASAALGSTIVSVTDEFFAPAINMLNPAPALHCPGRFVDTGAWMDGWETKRHNPNFDQCVIKLGFAGKIRGYDIDTSYFTGNQAPAASVEGTFSTGDDNLDKAEWVEILPKVDLPPSSHNVFVLEKETDVFTHLRLNNYPDGGIARFRVYGQVQPIWPENVSEVLDLAFVGNGGRPVHCTNEHYTPASNLLLPGRGANMGDGWETKRSRVPGHSDQAIIRLGDKGHLLKVEVDTSHYKGNYPSKIKLEAILTDSEIPDDNNDAASQAWATLIEPTPVGPHGLFYFDPALTDKVFSHVRFSIIPDGGVKRLRVYGIRAGGQLPKLPIPNPECKQEAKDVVDTYQK